MQKQESPYKIENAFNRKDPHFVSTASNDRYSKAKRVQTARP